MRFNVSMRAVVKRPLAVGARAITPGRVLLVPLLCFSGSAGAAPPRERLATQTPCTPTGEWILKCAPVPEASSCGKGKLSRKPTDERFIIAKRGPAFEVRGAGPAVSGERLRATTTEMGGCRVNYTFTEELSLGTPLEQRVEYELVEKNNVVSGIRVASTLADAPNAPPVCTEISVVVGARKDLSADALTIDEKRVPADFLAYYTKFMKDECRLPVNEGRKKDIVAVRMIVGRDGELKALWIDGVDQHITENCNAVVAEGRSAVLHNPTDKEKTLEFAVRLP